MHNTGKQKKIFDFRLLSRILSFSAAYRRKFIFSILLSVLLAIMAPLRPLLIQTGIEKGIAGGEAGFFMKGPGSFLIEITIIQVLFLMIETIFKFYFSYLTAWVGQSVVRDLRNKTFHKIIGLKLRQFDQTPIGTLTTRTINDIESVNDIFSDGLIPIIADLLSIVAVLIYMFYTSWRVTLVCLSPFPLLLFATYFFKESVNKSFIKVRNAVSALNAFVQEHLSGISVVQSFAAEEQEAAKFEQINRQHRDANIAAIFAYSVFFPLVELISALSIGLLVWWVASQSMGSSLDNPDAIAGVVTSFILCLNLLFRPLRMIADKFNVLQMGMIASERVFKVLDNPDEEVKNTAAAPVERLKGEIEFDQVSFGYLPGQEVLKALSFRIPAGSSLAIVGSTGSGKTSIISLINQLYTHEQGKISIDGTDIKNMNSDQLRSNIAVVLQDVFLFSGSILDNITLYDPSIRQADVERIAELLGIHQFISGLPGGYQYQVMERGAGLSAGQRQLIAFIRALVYDPSILILDEATSSVDSESEQLIRNAIGKMIKGRTSIVIAHRLSTIKKADQIIVLDKGIIVESGTHEQLLTGKGYYFRLCEAQFREEGA